MKLLNAGFSGKRLPVHVKPKEDELLSSWLTRLAISHGLDPQTLFSFIQPKEEAHIYYHIDSYASPKFIRSLVSKTGVPTRRVKATTTESHEVWLNQEHYDYWQSFPRNLHTYYLERSVALQFCPHCLEEDDSPYFRRVWRLGLFVICHKHNTILIDRCTKCGEHLSLFNQRKNTQYKHSKNFMTLCRFCNFDLRNSSPTPIGGPVNKEEIKFQDALMRIMKQGWAEVPQSGCIYSHLYFEVLQKLMEMSMQFHEIACKYYKIPGFAIEDLSTNTRRGLVGIVRRFLEDWPSDFIKFWKVNKISRAYPAPFYYDRMKLLPFWFWSVVHDHLIELEYKPSQEEMFAEHNYRYKDFELLAIDGDFVFLPKDR